MYTGVKNQEVVSEETFDAFIDSRWPRLLGGLANQVCHGVSEEEGFKLLWGAVELATDEEKKMLYEIGIIGMDPRYNPYGYPPTVHITEFGRQVVSACEGVFTREEYESFETEAIDRLTRRAAQADADPKPNP